MRKKIQRASNPAMGDENELATMATIYGCCGLFDMCSDNDLMSLSFEGTQPFLDWVGWEMTDVCKIVKNFITYVAPDGSTGGHTGARTAGYIADACGASNGVDWGSCDFQLDDFALLRRHGPTRDATKSRLRLCEQQPRYRLDGTPITSDAEYDMRLVTESMMQDLKRMMIDGSSLTRGQFDGLETLVKTGYTDTKGHYCQLMDSIVIDWDENGMDGTGGNATPTWNGTALNATYNFIDVLLATLRHIKDRIDWAPALSAQSMNVGDIIFLAPSNLIRCVLNAFTCWSVCDGAQYNEVVLQSYEARTFRQSLAGGMFGAGRIFLDGFEIPMCPYNWVLQKHTTLSDAYLLTGSVGGIKTISGQMLDQRNATTDYPEAGYSITDGGRLLTWLERQKTCVYREVQWQPRLLSWTPWANVRFEDVKCLQPGPVLSADPWNSSFFPETSFTSATCPA